MPALFSRFWVAYSKPLKFLFFGGCSALIEFGAFALVHNFFPIYVSSFLSMWCGLISSFIFNRLIVFRSETKGKSAALESAKFLALGLVNSQISATITTLLAMFLPKFVAKISTMTVMAIWNYCLLNLVIFRKSGK